MKVIVPTPSEEINLTEFIKRINQAFVYGWKRGDKYLYIGSTNQGFNRFKDHHAIIEGFEEDDDTFVFWYCNNETESRILEAKLILFYVPVYNKMRNLLSSNPEVERFSDKLHKARYEDAELERMKKLRDYIKSLPLSERPKAGSAKSS